MRAHILHTDAMLHERDSFKYYTGRNRDSSSNIRKSTPPFFRQNSTLVRKAYNSILLLQLFPSKAFNICI
jgi:hypothetical protein